jgi:hypothetical protein
MLLEPLQNSDMSQSQRTAALKHQANLRTIAFSCRLTNGRNERKEQDEATDESFRAQPHK